MKLHRWSNKQTDRQTHLVKNDFISPAGDPVTVGSTEDGIPGWGVPVVGVSPTVLSCCVSVTDGTC